MGCPLLSVRLLPRLKPPRATVEAQIILLTTLVVLGSIYTTSRHFGRRKKQMTSRTPAVNGEIEVVVMSPNYNCEACTLGKYDPKPILRIKNTADGGRVFIHKACLLALVKKATQ